ncbi:hypothetical protein MtrunA17_Chr7g0231011 [Medicago truncatula]|uniref:Uncharacterized protein n=1 Tax=Medicago truncatula TaxID=3880 RepID=A0A396GWF0_MEDTR|nr:hypothetical protein MtrunA17_Chr7g0231011 [Medicago truncatula]
MHLVISITTELMTLRRPIALAAFFRNAHFEVQVTQDKQQHPNDPLSSELAGAACRRRAESFFAFDLSSPQYCLDGIGSSGVLFTSSASFCFRLSPIDS